MENVKVEDEMADIDLMPESIRQRIDDMEKATELCSSVATLAAKWGLDTNPIGIATEDGNLITDGVFSAKGQSAPPYSSGRYITDANTAMKTLPRIVQRMIYRYAKWRM